MAGSQASGREMSRVSLVPGLLILPSTTRTSYHARIVSPAWIAVRPGPGEQLERTPDPPAHSLPVLLHDLASPAATREEAAGDDRCPEEERQDRDGRRHLRHGGLGGSNRRQAGGSHRRRQGREDDHDPVERHAGAGNNVREGGGGLVIPVFSRRPDTPAARTDGPEGLATGQGETTRGVLTPEAKSCRVGLIF